MYSILLAERPSDKRTVLAEKDVMLLQDHTFHAKEVRINISDYQKADAAAAAITMHDVII